MESFEDSFVSEDGDASFSNDQNEFVEKDWVEIESDFFNRYRSGHCISFDYYGQSPDFPPKAVQDLLHLISTRGGNCPFAHFKLGTYNPAIKEFLEICAPSMTELHLAHWSYRDSKFFTEGVPQNLNFQELKKLHIKLIVDDGETYNVKKFFAFIAEIFRGAPLLQELTCTLPGVWDGEGMEELLRSLVFGGDSNGLLLRSLKRLELSGRFLPTHFLILSALDELRLKGLALKFCGVTGKNSTSPKCVKRFLQSQSSSLESLHFEDVDSTTKCFISFPRMEKLKDLKISGSHLVGGGLGMNFLGVNYSKQFPLLEDLTLVRVGEGEWKSFVDTDRKSNLTSSTLKRLEIKDSEVDDFHLTDAGRNKIQLIFPNLKDFLYE